MRASRVEWSGGNSHGERFGGASESRRAAATLDIPRSVKRDYSIFSRLAVQKSPTEKKAPRKVSISRVMPRSGELHKRITDILIIVLYNGSIPRTLLWRPGAELARGAATIVINNFSDSHLQPGARG